MLSIYAFIALLLCAVPALAQNLGYPRKFPLNGTWDYRIR